MANQYSADVPKGFNVPKQVRLDSITGVQNEVTLKNLGTGNSLAFKYYEGLKVYCKDEKKEYVWRQVIGSETGLLTTHFVYPTYPAVDGIDYSGKSFNFFLITNPIVTPPDGSETKIISGTPNVVIEGNGTEGDEYVINVEIDGSETKINAGANITKSGTGTTANPYVINADLSNLGIVKTIDNEIIAPGQSLSIINNETSGKALVTKEYVQSVIPTITDGSETKIDAGTNITVTGNGTSNNPYVINTNISESSIYTGQSPTTIKVGGLEIGANILGKSYNEIIESIVAPYVLPTINSFTIPGQPQTVESGSTISGFQSFVLGFTQIQNILTNSLNIFFGSTNLASNFPIFSPVNVTIPLTNLIGNGVNYSFQSKVLATDDVENPTEITSSLFTITSRYRQFFGNVINFPTNSTEIRALANSNFANTNSWTTPIISTTKFSLSIPATKTLVSVITANFENITSSFTLNTFNVNDLGGNSISYKTYNYVSALPLNLTLTITTS